MSDDQEELDRMLRRVPQAEATTSCVDDAELGAYRLGKLTAERVEPIELHLAHCHACRSLLRELAHPLSLQTRTRAEAAFETKSHSRPRWAWGGGLGLALAAGLAMFFFVGQAPKLPRYELEGPLGGIRQQRGNAPATEVFALEGTIRFLARPAVAALDPVRVTVLRIDTEDRLVDVTGADWTVSPEGGVRWSAPVRSVVREPGRTRLAMVLTPEDYPPQPWGELASEVGARSRRKR